MRSRSLFLCACTALGAPLGCADDPVAAAPGGGASGGAASSSGGAATSGGAPGGSGGTSAGGANESGGANGSGGGGNASGSGGGGGASGSGGSGNTNGSGGGGNVIDPDGGGAAVYPAPGQRTGPGVLPASTARAPEYLGTLEYDNANIVRDLGYSGVVNGQVVWTFGDTLVKNGSGYTFTASDSAALGDLENPLEVHDKHVNASGWPQEWIPLNASETSSGGLTRWAMGGTNVVEFAPNKGLVWFLKNDRQGGSDSIVGAGVATVVATEKGPIATRNVDTMWASYEPYWGDIGVTYDPRDGHVYVFGHGPTELDLKANTFLAKVPATSATDVNAYRYWDEAARGWRTSRYGNGQNGTFAFTSAQAIFTYAGHGQSNAFWSNHYNTWMFVYGADWPDSDIYVSTAPNLEGPWSKALSIGKTCPPGGSCGTLRYCIAPHPEFDPSGKTVLVTWTDANVIHAVRVTWE